MAFKFESIQIWSVALDLTSKIGDLAHTFPTFELYSLSSQIRRAADSVVLNIAEDCTGQSNREFNRFLGYSLRSAIEVVSCLFIARQKAYIDEISFKKFYESYEVLVKMISKFKSAL